MVVHAILLGIEILNVAFCKRRNVHYFVQLMYLDPRASNWIKISDMNRGKYYRNKYGGKSRHQSGNARNNRESEGGDHEHNNETHHALSNIHQTQNWKQLSNLLKSIDHKSYGAYHELEKTFIFEPFDQDDSYADLNTKNYHPLSFTLHFDHIQGDAYANPSRAHVRIPSSMACMPKDLYDMNIRNVALCDYLTRKLADAVQQAGVDAKASSSSWHSTKRGDLSIMKPSQHVLKRTIVAIENDGTVEMRFQINLPARGRSICGEWARTILVETLPHLIYRTLIFTSLEASHVLAHIHSVEDQEALRNKLSAAGLVAFIRNGAILPRKSGCSDLPLDADTAIPFASPSTMETSFELPNCGKVTGMGIPKGVTLFVGGGYHGKTTVLRVLEVGIYNHVPSDGREFVVIDGNAVKIRAEDARSIVNCDIRPFINNLPFIQDTSSFSTKDASGSTSQAAFIMEALEVGATTLLIDEDTCATNFMIRDWKMQQLVASDKEPITPFISKVRSLFTERKVSTILVMGGAGDYFSVADRVIMMDSYRPIDVTERAKAIAEEQCQISQSKNFGNVTHRLPLSHGFQPNGKIVTRTLHRIQFGNEDLELAALEQLVEVGQTRAIADAIVTLSAEMDGQRSLSQLLESFEEKLEKDHSPDFISSMRKPGFYSRPRKLEVSCGSHQSSANCSLSTGKMSLGNAVEGELFQIHPFGRAHRFLFLATWQSHAEMSAEASQKTLGPLVALLKHHDRRMAITEEKKPKGLSKCDAEASKLLQAPDANNALPSDLMEMALQQANDHLDRLESLDKEVESLHGDHQPMERLRGKLRRRNELLDVICRSYYHDVIVVKEELRRQQSIQSSPHSSAFKTLMRTRKMTEAFSAKQNGMATMDNLAPESFLSSIPSVDLRGVLPLFAPADSMLKVNPCDLCGGTIELLHGETREMIQLREECHRANDQVREWRDNANLVAKEKTELRDLAEALEKSSEMTKMEVEVATKQLHIFEERDQQQNASLTELRQQLERAMIDRERLHGDIGRIAGGYDDTLMLLKAERVELEALKRETKVLGERYAQLQSDHNVQGFQYQTSLQSLDRAETTLRETQIRLEEYEKVAEAAEISLQSVQRELRNSTLQNEELKKTRDGNSEMCQVLQEENNKYKRRMDELQKNFGKLGMLKGNADMATWDIEGSVEAGLLGRPATYQPADNKPGDRSLYMNLMDRDQVTALGRDAVGPIEDAEDDESFRAYCKQLESYLTEIENLRTAHQDQQKVIRELEQSKELLQNRLEETTSANESLTASVDNLSVRLEQEHTTMNELREKLQLSITDSKRENEYDTARLRIVDQFVRSICDQLHGLTQNAQFLKSISFEKPNLDEKVEALTLMSDAKGTKRFTALTPELLQRKKELRKKVVYDKALKQFRQECSGFAQVIALELKRLMERNTQLNQLLELATLKLEDAKNARNEVETKLLRRWREYETEVLKRAKLEKELDLVVQKLDEMTRLRDVESMDHIALKQEHHQLQNDHARLVGSFAKASRALEKTSASKKNAKEKLLALEGSTQALISERDRLAKALKTIQDEAAYKLRTKRSVETDTMIVYAEKTMQTDAWKPEGLVLRQRNAINQTPQRYLGNTTMLIAYPTTRSPLNEVDTTMKLSRMRETISINPSDSWPSSTHSRPLTAICSSTTRNEMSKVRSQPQIKLRGISKSKS
uniref:Uncharacterized protein AlNc14C37G3266 n=1 Tax=Albugo laibachii Nc14 TaxID=890382 RepID=F0W8Z6_9STRA|nr:conserved hypothetical protein [Albugo laibachii Nc14]|eukprot:CCA17607.1 conserved hypothetical protein [Albugo laibachii Nc14]